MNGSLHDVYSKVWGFSYLLRNEDDHQVVAHMATDLLRIECPRKGPVVQQAFELTERFGVEFEPSVTNLGDRWFEASLSKSPIPEVPPEIQAFHTMLIDYQMSDGLVYRGGQGSWVVVNVPTDETADLLRHKMRIPKGRARLEPVGPLGSQNWKLWFRESDVLQYGRSLL